MKSENHSILQADLLPLDNVFREKGEFHDDRLGKWMNIVKSHFSFLSFCLTNFWAIAWFSILLENENFENPENQPKWLASLLILNKLFEKNGCNQNLHLVKLIAMVYFILLKNRFKGSYCKWSKVIICDYKKCLYFVGLKKSLRVVSKFMDFE